MMSASEEEELDRRIALVHDRVAGDTASASSFENAADSFVRAFYETFADFTILVRVFAIVPYRRLDADERTYVGPLHESTPVLSLLGTHGIEPQWNDRKRSAGHRAIPLVSEAFVEEAPMIAKLFAELGDSPFNQTDGDWQFVKRTADTDGLFFVGDARTTTDPRGRRVIPAVDFVARYGVRTVFGFGARGADGSLAVVIVFARKALLRSFAQRFVDLIELLRTGPGSVAQTALFESFESSSAPS